MLKWWTAPAAASIEPFWEESKNLALLLRLPFLSLKWVAPKRPT